MTWSVVELGEVADTALGKMLDKAKTKGHAHAPYLRNVNVQWGRIDTDDLLTMELADSERERFAVREGDLLVCEGGDIGRCAIWHGQTEYLAYQKALHRIRPSDRLDTQFLRYLMEHHSLSGQLARLATGTTIAHLPQQQLRRVPVPLPPLDEQRRIVELLEDHLSRLDAASRSIADSLVRLKALRDSALLSLLAAAKRAGQSETHSLGELAKVNSGMTPLRGNKTFYEGGTIPWITSGDLHQGLITKPTQFVTQRALEETSLKIVPAGSLLVAMYGEGKTRGTAAELGLDATTNQACAAITLHEPDLRAWVRLILDANYTGLRRLAAGGVQPNLNLSLIKAIEVSVPPADTRRMLISRITRIDEARERMKEELLSAQRRGTNLRRSLLKAAFSGRLTGAKSDLSAAEEMIGA